MNERLAVVCQHGPDAGFQPVEMPINHGGNRLCIDLAKVVVHQDVAETADVAPRDFRPDGFPIVGKMLDGFGERLQVAQGGIVEDVRSPRA